MKGSEATSKEKDSRPLQKEKDDKNVDEANQVPMGKSGGSLGIKKKTPIKA